MNYGIITLVLKAHNFILMKSFFQARVTYFGIVEDCRKRIDYIILPRATLDNVQECMVSWRKGQRLQHIRCTSAKDHFPVQVSFYHTFEYQQYVKKVCKPNAETCNAMLLYGHQREAFIKRVEDRLSQHQNQFEQWEYEGTVDQIDAGMMECVGDVANEMLTTAPGYTGKADN
eukprot:3254348-Pyramimonas_sp.AAC.1